MIRDDNPIPIPPFADANEAQLFVKQLAAHVASLDRQQVSLPTFILLSVLQESHHLFPGNGLESTPPQLPAFILQIALLSRFPAPWTPQGLHAARAAGDEWTTTPATRSRVLREGIDPIFEARQNWRGRWTAAWIERGHEQVLHRDLSDDELIEKFINHYVGTPFPYGWRSQDTTGFADIVNTASQVRDEWDSGFAHAPYLTNWIALRDSYSTD